MANPLTQDQRFFVQLGLNAFTRQLEDLRSDWSSGVFYDQENLNLTADVELAVATRNAIDPRPDSPEATRLNEAWQRLNRAGFGEAFINVLAAEVERMENFRCTADMDAHFDPGPEAFRGE